MQYITNKNTVEHKIWYDHNSQMVITVLPHNYLGRVFHSFIM